MAKQNKKSFSDNLESLMEYNLYEDNLQDNPSMFEIDKTEKVVVEEEKVEKLSTKKKTGRKSFSDGLESFFKESIEEAIGDSTVTEMKRGVVKKGKKKAIGIEILLQRTMFENQKDGDDDKNLCIVSVNAALQAFSKSLDRKTKREGIRVLTFLPQANISAEENAAALNCMILKKLFSWCVAALNTKFVLNSTLSLNIKCRQ